MHVASIVDFIAVFDNVLDAPLCQQIIQKFDADSKKRAGMEIMPDGTRAPSTNKVSVDLDVTGNPDWDSLHAAVHKRVGEAIQQYLAGSPVLPLLQLRQTGYKIQMYHQGKGHFKWHCDVASLSTSCRQIALVLYLNDVAKGGETEFFYQKLKVQPKTGTLILFPPFWGHLHCGHVPESGNKYILTSFVELA
jgi:2OG-Fe(II) oxygenase superfamily